MHVLVLGCGAIGGIFAAHLGRVTQVTVYDVWKEHVERINREGLTIDGKAQWTTKVRAVNQPGALSGQTYDFAILAVKGIHTRQVIEEVAPYIEGTYVLSVQNGIGNEEIIAEVIGAERVIQGVTFMAGTAVGPGNIRYSIEGKTWIGPFQGAALDKVRKLGEALAESGLEVEVNADVRGAVWSKFLFNIAVNPLSCILGMSSAYLIEFEPVREIMKQILDEGKKVAEALGIQLLYDPEEKVFAPRPKGKQAHLSSMGQDIAAGRLTEIDFLNGALVAKAKEVGLSVSANEMMTRLVKGLEWKITHKDD